MEKAVYQRLNAARRRYESAVSAAPMRYPLRMLHQLLQSLDYLSANLVSSGERRIEILKNRLERAGGQLESLSPAATLKRGYSITYLKDAKEPLTSSSGLKAGDKMKTVFCDGQVLSEIREEKNNE